MAVVLEFFVSRYLGKLSDFIEGEICKVVGVREEIERLHRKLSRISPYIQDAEKRRHSDAAINNWVKELKDVMYDAEDIIDLCMVEGGRLLEAQPSASSGVCSPISLLSSCFHCSMFRRNIWNRIKSINERLDEIKVDNNVVPRLVAHANEGVQNNSVRTSSPTSPTHVTTDIVGTQIVDAAQNLISKIDHSKKKYSVFGISGMGGIGKTTLAQKIFNDEMVNKQFAKRVWLHVSKHYSQIEILKQVLRGVGGNDDGAQTRAEVEGRIVPLLSESLLLVLDDIWSANVWRDLLRNIISKGSCRTAILFTTRRQDVAAEMRADFVHPADKMDQGGGWELIRKFVFGDEEDVIISELKEFGMEIVKKCDGLPLAVKVVAGVLFHKERSKTEWRRVAESDLWSMNEIDDELSNALYLSYEDLPSHLKQCFLSCAFYRGTSFRRDIIRLWVAEGFVIEQSDNLMENIAEDYYKELIARNLLQFDFRFLDGVKFVMHDVLQSFGEKLMEEEGIFINDGQFTSTNSSTKIRRLSVSNQGDVLSLPNVIVEQKCLRALHVVNCPQLERIENHAFESLKRLRVLNLCDAFESSVHDSLADITFLKLQNFPSCTVLPPLGQLPNLKELHIEGGEAIRSIGCKFLGCRTPAFPKLEYLAFKNMLNWEAWVLRDGEDVVVPNEDVHLSNFNLFPNLKECNIISCPKLKNSILPSTSYLQINNCPNLEYVEKIGMLQKFEVVFPAEIKQPPQWMRSLINATLHSLHRFYMICNSLLLDSCCKGKQNWHIIQQIPEVAIYNIHGDVRLLLSKDSYKYEKKNNFGSFITLDQ